MQPVNGTTTCMQSNGDVGLISLRCQCNTTRCNEDTATLAGTFARRVVQAIRASTVPLAKFERAADFDSLEIVSIERSEALRNSGKRHAVHAFVYAIDDDGTPWIPILLRTGGSFGFVGGHVDDRNESFSEMERALTREWLEEVNCALEFQRDAHYFLTHYSHEIDYVLTLFVQRVDVATMRRIVLASPKAQFRSKEVLAVARVPTERHALAAFTRNSFIGSSLVQLCVALVRERLVTLSTLITLLPSDEKLSRALERHVAAGLILAD